MKHKARDRHAERAAIEAATGRLLAGTPLRSQTGKLTATELIIESGLRRDVIYVDHRDLIEKFQALAKTQNSTSPAVHTLTERTPTSNSA